MVILFDLDGTLIDSTEAILESFYVACDRYAFKRPMKEDIKSLIGYPLDIMFSKVGVKKEKVWDFVASYKEHYRKISKEKTKMLPNSVEAIQEAYIFARLAVVTTKTARYSKELLEHFGVLSYFETLVGREDVKNPKPHPEPINLALDRMGLEEKSSVYIIGDTKLDMESALKAGITPIAVLSGYDSKDTLTAYTDKVFKDSLEAVRFLSKK